MEKQENNMNETEMWRKWEKSHRRGRVFGGFLLVGVGIVFLMRELGVEIPHWVFTWKLLLIVLGLFIGFKHSFRHIGWLVLISIGGAFLLEEIYPGIKIGYILLPALIIFAGLMMIFRPKRQCRDHRWKKWHKYHDWKHSGGGNESSEDYIDSTSVFGSVKKNIISKDFKGGDISVFFGGAEINLSQADINGRVVLEISQAFGGSRLIVPPHWEIQSELVTVFGGIEDKRPVHKEVITDAAKVLVLKGTTFFGGIDIKSY
ncbi:MAG: LiaF transmembrane domain-containing protein [Bacteroidia bacterium]